MGLKEEFIARINDLITEGRNVVLRSKGIPKERINRNALEYDKKNYFPFGFEDYESEKLWLKQNIQKYTTYIPSIDINISFSWSLLSYNCLVKYFGEDNFFSNQLSKYTDGRIINKIDVERIIEILTATKIAIEQDEIKIDNMIKNNISNKIFVVHGHDEEAKIKVENFLRKMNFDPILLSSQASKGKTIIEKLEMYTDVGFGIVLYTPCDKTFDGNYRARQNVVLEHGYLMGKLGRSKVCALLKGDVEKPIDIDGVIYINMDNSNSWELSLSKELRAAGYEADANKI